MKKKVILYFLVFCSTTVAQRNINIDKYFEALRYNEIQDSKFIFNDSSHYENLIKEIKKYYKDSIIAVRKEAYYLTRLIGEKTHDGKLKKQVVLSLTQGCFDKDPSVMDDVAKSLMKFQLNDFSDEAKNNIRKAIEKSSYSFDKIVRVAGFLNLTDEKSSITNLISSGQLKGMNQWSARLALARMGDQKQLKFCVDKLKSIPLNSRALESIVPDLVYIRQKESLDYVFELIMSDAKNCTSSNPDNPVSIPCAYRVLKYPVFAVKDYPIKPDTYGDVEIVDYEKSLKDVREWIKINKGKYIILTDRY